VTLLRLHYTTHKATQIVRSSTGVSQAVTLLTAIPRWKYAIPSDLASQATLGRVSTWIGDGLGIPGAVSNDFFAMFKEHKLLLRLLAITEVNMLIRSTASSATAATFIVYLDANLIERGGGRWAPIFDPPILNVHHLPRSQTVCMFCDRGNFLAYLDANLVGEWVGGRRFSMIPSPSMFCDRVYKKVTLFKLLYIFKLICICLDIDRHIAIKKYSLPCVFWGTVC
jgi:hypothetical protein